MQQPKRMLILFYLVFFIIFVFQLFTCSIFAISMRASILVLKYNSLFERGKKEGK